MKRLALLPRITALLALGGCVSRSGAPSPAACALPPDYVPAGAYNAAAEANLAFSPFGRVEQGWAIYAPAIASTVSSACPAQSPAFARAIARWQARSGLAPHGGVDPSTFAAMKASWERRRPFVRVRAAGNCPDPPDEASLAEVPAADSYGGSTVRLRPGTLKALEAMTAAARREDPAIAAEPTQLTVVSGFRSPAYDAARCAKQNNCDGIVRATCSSHRTGLAVDLALGPAPGFMADSSAETNRLYQTRTPAYRWLLTNAARFGFVNYAFEPWHWEWTGEPP